MIAVTRSALHSRVLLAVPIVIPGTTGVNGAPMALAKHGAEISASNETEKRERNNTIHR
jgi:hypothetical protein